MLFWKRTADDVAWTSHLSGLDDTAISLRAQLEEVGDGSRHRFRFGETEGVFQKMRTGRDGRPTAGFRPVGETKRWWTNTKREAAGKLFAFQYLGRED